MFDIIPKPHRFINAIPAETVQTFHNCSCLSDNACKLKNKYFDLSYLRLKKMSHVEQQYI
jgi:hypothetical protein